MAFEFTPRSVSSLLSRDDDMYSGVHSKITSHVINVTYLLSRHIEKANM